MQQEAAAAEAELSATRGELAIAQEDRIRFEAELRRLEEAAENNRKAAEADARERETLSERAAECRRTMEAADKETAEISAKQKTVEAELEKMTGGRQELTQKREELSAQIADKKLAAVAGLKEIEAHEASIAALRERQRMRPAAVCSWRNRRPRWKRATPKSVGAWKK
ncbi:MAG: hypothetical protein ACLSS9_06985 [Acutalibacteraceae bacterium]